MTNTTISKISLYKELQVLQKAPNGVKMVYTCYEAIPNGGFCIISAEPDNGNGIQLKSSTYIKNPLGSEANSASLFFPTLIAAINAYSDENTASHTAS